MRTFLKPIKILVLAAATAVLLTGADYVRLSPGPNDIAKIYNVKNYGALGDGVTDDTVAIQNAINDAQLVNGTVVLENKTYAISDELVISASIVMQGFGCMPQNGTHATTANTMNLPLTTPYLNGSVLLQTGAGKNGIRITTNGRTVQLHKFGVRFADSIKFTNTGHGIFAQPGTVSTYRDNGPFYSNWDEVMVYGHDGNHYGFYIINPICSTFTELQSWGGGGLCVENNGFNTGGAGHYGNSVFVHFYGAVVTAGSAHGIYLKGTSGAMNFLTFIRPQAMTINEGSDLPGVTAPTSAQKTFICDANVSGFHLLGPDFESGVGSAVSIPAASMAGSFISPGYVDNDPVTNSNGKLARLGVEGISIGTPPAGLVSGMANTFLFGTSHGAQLVLGLNVEQAGFTVYDGVTYLDFTGGLVFRNFNSGSPLSVGSINVDGSWTPPHEADGAAPNDSVYFSNTAGKLVYKNAAGTVNALY